MIYAGLFWSFFQIGLFSIGGGYAAMPLIQNQVVEINAWLTMNEFADLVTIAEMTPGPIAVNAATFVGIRVGGIPGALTATAGCILPSCIIVLAFAFLYKKYGNIGIVKSVLGTLHPAVVAFIASAGLSILLQALKSAPLLSPGGTSSFTVSGAVLFALSLVILRKWKPDPVYVMAGCGAVGVLLCLVSG